MCPRRDPSVTSRIMSSVGNKDSKPEILLRSELHRRGIRYRLHASDVVGRPDMVIRKHKFAVFVDGDMWHGNEHRRRGLDSLEELFPSNTEWWVKKIRRNMERDRHVTTTLRRTGWVVVRVWASEVLEDVAAAADRVENALERARERSPK